uniref:Uncharacterized protein n=1 Tax=Eutreptiella gymnastica TaxID=73025 RepID=A0A7S1IW52_9EUGL|mmetsp:Transcript_46386/g.82918  ORF Transcript_46386/g.82918 Transcript_46386/m.82918 type:complete len:5294 (+) Transcript_46386:87-15968(+)
MVEGERVRWLETQIDDLRTSLQLSEDANRYLKEEVEQYQSEVLKLRTALQASEESCELLQGQINKLSDIVAKQRASEEQRANDTNHLLEEKDKELVGLEDQIAKLMGDLAAERSKRIEQGSVNGPSRQRVLEEEALHLNEEIRRLCMNHALEKQGWKDKFKESDTQVSLLKAEIKNLVVELEDLRGPPSLIEPRASSVASSEGFKGHDTSMVGMYDSITERHVEVVQRHIQSYDDAKARSELALQVKENKTLRSQLLEQSIAHNNTQHSLKASEDHCERLKEEIADVRKKLYAQEDTIIEAERAKGILQAKENEIARVLAQMKSLTMATRAEEDARRDAEATAKAAQQRALDLESQLKILATEAQDLRHSANSKGSEVTQLVDQVTALTELLRDEDRRLEHSNNKRQRELELEVERLRLDLEQCHATYTKDLRHKEEKIEDLAQKYLVELQHKAAEVTRVEKLRSNAEATAEQVRRELGTQKDQVRDASRKIDQLEIDNTSLERQIKDITFQLENANAESNRSKNAIQMFEHTKVHLEEQIEDFQRALANDEARKLELEHLIGAMESKEGEIGRLSLQIIQLTNSIRETQKESHEKDSTIAILRTQEMLLKADVEKLKADLTNLHDMRGKDAELHAQALRDQKAHVYAEHVQAIEWELNQRNRELENATIEVKKVHAELVAKGQELSQIQLKTKAQSERLHEAALEQAVLQQQLRNAEQASKQSEAQVVFLTAQFAEWKDEHQKQMEDRELQWLESQQQMQTLTVAAKDADRLLVELDILRRRDLEATALQKQLHEATTTISTLRTESRHQKESLESELQGHKLTKEQQERLIQQLQAQLTQQSDQVTKLSTRLEQVSSQLELTQSKCKEAEQAALEDRRMLWETEQSLCHVQEQNEKLQEQMGMLQSQVRAASKDAGLVEAKDAEIQRLVLSCKADAVDKVSVMELSTKLRILEDTLQEKINMIDQLKAQIKDSELRMHKKQAEWELFQEDVRTTARKNASLTQQLQQAQETQVQQLSKINRLEEALQSQLEDQKQLAYQHRKEGAEMERLKVALEYSEENISELKKQVADLLQKLCGSEAHGRDAAKLAGALEATQQEVATRDTQLSAMQARLADLERECATAAATQLRLQDQTAHLTQELQAKEEASAQAQRNMMAQLEQLRELMHQKDEDLEKLRDQAKASAAVVHTLRGDVAQSAAEIVVAEGIAQEKTEALTIVTKQLEERDAQVENLEMKCSAMESNLLQLELDKEDLLEKVGELETEVEQNAALLTQLQTKVVRKEEDSGMWESKARETEAALAEHRKALHSCQESNTTVLQQNTELMGRLAELDKLAEDGVRMVGVVQAKDAEIARLEIQVRDYRALEATCKGMDHREQALRETIAQLKQELQDTKVALQAVQAARSEDQAQSTIAIDRKQVQVERLLLQTSEAEAANANHETKFADLSTQLAAVQQMLQVEKDENEKLHHKVLELESSSCTLQHCIDDLESASRVSAVEVSDLHRQLREAHAEVEKEVIKVAAGVAALDAAHEKHAILQAQIQSGNLATEKLQAAVASAERQVMNLQEQNAGLITKLLDAEERVRDGSKLIAALELKDVELRRLEDQTQALHQELKESGATIVDAKSANNILESEMNQWKAKAAAAETAMMKADSTAQENSSKLWGLIQERTMQVEDLQQRLDASSDRISGLSMSQARLEAEVSNANATAQRGNDDLARAVAEVAQRDRQLLELQEKMANVEGVLKSEQHKKEQLSEELKLANTQVQGAADRTAVLQANVEARDATIQGLQSRLEDRDRAVQEHKQSVQLQTDQVNQVQAHNGMLQKRIQELEGVAGLVAAKDDEIKRLEQSLRDMHEAAAVQRVHEAAFSAAQQRQQELEKVANDMRAQLHARDKAAAALHASQEAQRAKAEAAIDKKEEAMERLRRQLQESENTKAQQEILATELAAKLDSSYQAIQDRQQMIDKLQSQIVSHTASAEKQHIQFEKLKDELRDSRTEVSDLKHQLQRSSLAVGTSERQVEDLKKQLSVSEERGRDAAKLSGALEATQMEVARLEAALQLANDRLRQEEKDNTSAHQGMKVLQDEVERLKGEILNKNNAIQQMEASATNQANELRRTLQQRDEDGKLLQEQVKALGQAIGDLKAHAAQSTAELKIAQATIQGHVEEAQKLRGQLEDRVATIAELQQGMSGLEADTRSQASQLDDTKLMLQEANEKLETSRNQIAQLQATVGVKDGKIEALASKLKDLEVHHQDKDTSLRDANTVITKLRDQNDQLTAHISELEADALEAAHNAGQLVAKDSEIGRLAEEVAALREDAEDRNASELALAAGMRRQQELENDVERLHVELQNRDKALDRAHEQISKANAAMENNEGALERLHQQVMAAEEAKSKERALGAELSGKLNAAQGKLADMSDQIKELQKQVRSQGEDVIQAKGQNEGLQDDLRAAELGNVDLQRQLQQVNQALTDQSARVSQLERTLGEVQAENKRMTTDAREDSSEISRLSQSLVNAEADIARSEKEIQELREKLSISDERARESAKLSGALSTTQNEVARLEAALKSVSDSLRQEEKGRIIAQEMARSLQIECEKQKSELSNKISAMERMEANAKEHADQLKQTLQRREHDLTKLQEEIKALGTENRNLVSEAAQSASDLKIAQAASESQATECQRLKAVVEDREARISQLQIEAAALQADARHQALQIDDLTRRMEDLREKLDASRKETADQRDALGSRDTKVELLASELQAAQKTSADLESSLKGSTAEISKIRDQNDQLSARIMELEAGAREASRTAGMMDAKDSEIARLAHELAALHEDVEDKHATEAALAAAMRRQQDLEGEASKLSGALAAKENELMRLEGEFKSKSDDLREVEKASISAQEAIKRLMYEIEKMNADLSTKTAAMERLEASANEGAKELKEVIKQRDNDIKELRQQNKASENTAADLRDKAFQSAADLKIAKAAADASMEEATKLKDLLKERAETITELLQQVASLESMTRNQAIQIDDLKNRLQDAQGKLEASSTRAAELEASAAAQDGEVQLLASKLQDAQNNMEDRVQSLKANDEAISNMRDQNAALSARITELEAEAREAARNSGLVDAKDVEIGRLSQELAGMRADLEEQRGTEVALAAAVRRQQDLENQLERLTGELQSRDKASSRLQLSLEDQIAKAGAANDKHQQDQEQLRREIIATENAKSQEQARNAELSAKMAVAQEKLSDRQAQIENLQEQIEERDLDIQNLKTEKDTLAEEIKSGAFQLADVSRQLQHANEAVQQERERVVQLDNALKNSQAEVKQLAAEAREDAADMSRLKQALENAEVYHAKSEMQIAELKEKLSDAEERGREASRLSGALTMAQAEIERLSNTLKATSDSLQMEQKENSAAQERASALQDDLDNLQIEMMQKVRSMEQIEAEDKENAEQLKHGLQQCYNELDQLRTQLKAAWDTVAELKGDKVQLAAQVSIAEAAAADQAEEVQRLKAVRNDRDAKISELQQTAAGFEADARNQAVVNEDLKDKFQEVQEKFAASTQKIADLQAAAGVQNAKLEALTARLQDAERTAAERERSLRASEENASKLRDQSDRLSATVSELEAEAREAAHNAGLIAAKNEEIGRLSQELELLQEDLQAARAQEVTLATSMKRQQELEDDLQALKGDLEGRDKANAKLQDSIVEQMNKSASALEKKEEAMQKMREQIARIEEARAQEAAVNADLSRKLQANQEALTDKSNEADKRRADLNAANAEIQDLKQQNQDSASQIQSAAAEIASVKRQLEIAADQLSESQAEVKQMSAQAQDDKSEISRLGHALSNAEQNLAKSEKQNQQLSDSLRQLEKSDTLAQERVSNLHHEIERLKTELQGRDTAVEGLQTALAEQGQKLAAAAEKYQEMLEQLRQELAAAQKETNHVQALNAELSAKIQLAQDRHLDLQDQIVNLQAQMKERDTVVRDVEKQKEQLKDQVRTAAGDIADLQRQLQQATVELQQAREHAAQVEAALKDCQVQLTEMTEQTNEKSSQISQLKQALTDKEGLCAKSEEQIIELKERLSESEERAREASRLSGVLEATQADLTRLESALELATNSLRDREKENAGAQERINSLQNEIERLKADVSDKINAMERMEASAKEQSDELKHTLQQRDESVKELQEKLEACSDEVSNLKAENYKMAAELTVSQNTVTDQAAELQRTQTLLSDRDARILDLQTALSEKEVEAARNTGVLEAKDAEIQRLEQQGENLTKQVEDLNNVSQQQQAILREKEAEIKRLEADLEALHRTVESLELFGVAKDKDLNVLREQLKGVTDERDQLQEGMATMQEQMRQNEQQIADYQEQMTILQQENLQLTEESKTKDLEIERLATMSKTLEGQSAELQSCVDNLTQSLATTVEELAEAQSQIQALEQRVAQEEERASSVEASLQQEREELERLRSGMADQTAVLENVRQIGQQQAKELEEKTAQIQRMQEEVERLQADLASAQDKGHNSDQQITELAQQLKDCEQKLAEDAALAEKTMEELEDAEQKMAVQEHQYRRLIRQLKQKQGQLEELQQKMSQLQEETSSFRHRNARMAIIRSLAKIALDREAKRQQLWALFQKESPDQSSVLKKVILKNDAQTRALNQEVAAFHLRTKLDVSAQLRERRLRRQILHDTQYPKCQRWKLAVQQIISESERQDRNLTRRIGSVLRRTREHDHEGAAIEVEQKAALIDEKDKQEKSRAYNVALKKKIREFTAFFDKKKKPKLEKCKSMKEYRAVKDRLDILEEENVKLRETVQKLEPVETQLLRKEADAVALGKQLVLKSEKLAQLQEKLDTLLHETRRYRQQGTRQAIIRTIAKVNLDKREASDKMWGLFHAETQGREKALQNVVQKSANDGMVMKVELLRQQKKQRMQIESAVAQKKIRRDALRNTSYPKCQKWKSVVQMLIRQKREKTRNLLSRVESMAYRDKAALNSSLLRDAQKQKILRKERDAQKDQILKNLLFKKKVRALNKFFDGSAQQEDQEEPAPIVQKSSTVHKLRARAAEEEADKYKQTLQALPDLTEALEQALQMNTTLQEQIDRLYQEGYADSTAMTRYLAIMFEKKQKEVQDIEHHIESMKEEHRLELTKMKRLHCKMALKRALVSLAVERHHATGMWSMLQSQLRVRSKEEIARAITNAASREAELKELKDASKDRQLQRCKSILEKRKMAKEERRILIGDPALILWKKTAIQLMRDHAKKRRRWDGLSKMSVHGRRDAIQTSITEFQEAESAKAEAITNERREQNEAYKAALLKKRKMKQLNEVLSSSISSTSSEQ